MQNRNLMIRCVIVFAFVSLFAIQASSSLAANKKPNNSNAQKLQTAAQKQQQAADANAKKAGDAEKSAENSAASAKKNVAEVNDAIHNAQKDVDDATKTLKKVEDEIIDSQSADSDFGKARDEYRAADKKYQESRKSVLDSDEFKDRLAKARESDEPAPALLALKKEFDEMPAISESRTKVQETKEKYDPLRTKLLEGDSKWVDASGDLKAKKKVLDDLNRQYAAANAAANKAKADARKQAAAAAASAAAAQNAAAQKAAAAAAARAAQQNKTRRH